MNRPGVTHANILKQDVLRGPDFKSAALAAVLVIPVLAIVALAPGPMVLPVLSVVALIVAAGLALLALNAPDNWTMFGTHPREAANIAGLIWVVTAVLANPAHIVQFFGF